MDLYAFCYIVFKYDFGLKVPYSSKIDIFFIQERFNKLIYGINTIIKFGIWQPVSVNLSFFE